MVIPALQLDAYANEADAVYRALTGEGTMTPEQFGAKLRGGWSAMVAGLSDLPAGDVDFTYTAGYAQAQIMVRLAPAAPPEKVAPSPQCSRCSGSEPPGEESQQLD